MGIQEIMRPAVLISEDATLREAVQAMVKQQANSLLVVGEKGELVGEVEVPDLLDGVVPPYLDGDEVQEHFADETQFEKAVKEAADRSVSDFMTMDCKPVKADDRLIDIAATAIVHQRSRIPVVDHDNRPIGVVSRRGLKHILAKSLGIKDT
jgi:CBS domain-containing protein